MRDMGLPARRADGFVAEYFEPLDATRYEGLAEERCRAREKNQVGEDSMRSAEAV
jgi:hypothetical protein